MLNFWNKKDENNMKIIEKPWGKEEILEVNDKYVVKRLTMLKDHRCSLQYHEHKKETIYVLEGVLRIYIGEDSDNLTFIDRKANEFITINPFIVHRMKGVTDAVYLESSTIELDDVIRIQDDYDRN